MVASICPDVKTRQAVPTVSTTLGSHQSFHAFSSRFHLATEKLTADLQILALDQPPRKYSRSLYQGTGDITVGRVPGAKDPRNCASLARCWDWPWVWDSSAVSSASFRVSAMATTLDQTKSTTINQQHKEPVCSVRTSADFKTKLDWQSLSARELTSFAIGWSESKSIYSILCSCPTIFR